MILMTRMLNDPDWGKLSIVGNQVCFLAIDVADA